MASGPARRADGTTDGIGSVPGRTYVDDFGFEAVWSKFTTDDCGTQVDVLDCFDTTFKTAGRHPWRCRRTDRSRRAPASFEFGE
jgi:hypothetical protein